ncbi:mannose-6-phosphate isomerase [Eremomyces bilateralis CBS 781.70]|uniref:Mannose-6-phosphate isomerase n=1 Tax=Eremomyces bilateralis CBS 781.70 TaxID=1392243 RepID=A0A6G1GCJ3_9PEZI|nr:mannose-6-phosphate isomerase [Eremomyces bilateralis CBS 781.70]KAF1815620.1 mannose-6-phosphate isomerase [Eremomyces bilateralis CBS 781.70]
MQVPLIRLQCGVNSYDWGKVGKASAAARFAAASETDDFSIEEEKPYAELWMGTHPKMPSKDMKTQRSLVDLVQDNHALMSTEITSKYGGKLPFLFKVLSIEKVLSIQAHPNKKLAEQLHAKDPKNYPDDNHKPEMTIAITPFEGLCGFRPLPEIAHFLQSIPPLRRLVGEDKAKSFEEVASEAKDDGAGKKALREAFTSLMNGAADSLASASKELVALAESQGSQFAGGGGSSNEGQELADLVTRLNGEFPGDIGLFVLFFLNFVKLEPGEAMFLQADDIHAYISGDIIECMASSDNVVRAGFTPKFKDVSTLTSMLTYSYGSIEEQKMEPAPYAHVVLNAKAYSSNSSATLYDPPIEEFSVIKTELKKSEAKATFDPIAGPSIIICTSGEGTVSVGPKQETVKPGYVFFVGATAECVIESTGEDPLIAFQAFCELGSKSQL